MNAKEKAKELVDKYDEILTYIESKSKAKQCALIAVEEMIEYLTILTDVMTSLDAVKYWNDVKSELQSL